MLSKTESKVDDGTGTRLAAVTLATSCRVAPFAGTTGTEGGQVPLRVVRGDESSAVEHLGLRLPAEVWMRARTWEAAGNSPGWRRGSPLRG